MVVAPDADGRRHQQIRGNWSPTSMTVANSHSARNRDAKQTATMLLPSIVTQGGTRGRCG
jgi:hypothetical protein